MLFRSDLMSLDPSDAKRAPVRHTRSIISVAHSFLAAFGNAPKKRELVGTSCCLSLTLPGQSLKFGFLVRAEQLTQVQ